MENLDTTPSESQKKEREEELQKIDASMQKLKEESNQFFSTLGVSGDELHEFLENKENFSSTEWEYLLKQKKLLEEMLERRIEGSKKLKIETTACKEVKSHWIFIR